MSNERSRDFGDQSRGSDQGAAGRRDPGEEALLELARLIGGQTNSFTPDAAGKSEPRSDSHPDSRPDSRLGDVSRAAASQPYGGRPFDERPRRDADFEERRMAAPSVHPGDEPPGAAHGDDFGFREPPADFSDRGRSRGGRGSRDHGDRGHGGHDDYGHHDEYYAGDHAEDEYGENDDYEYEDEPEERRRRPTGMIMAVIVLGVLGSAAAYGYRTLIASAPSGPPPIIRADNSPTKMTPMSEVTPDNGRSDRAGEQMGPRREENPVDLAGAGNNSGAGNPDLLPPSGDDPKRVHTVPIRPDQGTANSPDRPAVSAAAPPPPPPPPAPPPPAHRVAAPLPPAPPPPPPQQRVAALPPPANAPAAAPPPESGGFVVQLVSVRSEADAQSEFRRLQAKFSSVLTGRQPLIRRKDRGDQVYYAALVGPFGVKTEADQFCEQLKAAGGACYVYKN